MRDVTQSTESQVIIKDAKETTVRFIELLAIVIGIGTVTVLGVVVVVVIVVRQRKRHLQLTNNKSPVTMSAYSDYKANCQVTVEKAVLDNNFHVNRN
ncbi:hypothetical protein DPMN_077315 [Dreissena polymorpha]|uniref:Uncharacterized protein n=1 Tax=Dreissena polymorpha TaxID=45954 RepID=A0A9D4BR87_DREPO|nr:hypothetical protein DPMN_077315 [Dreissena polymorpha]